MDVDNIDYLDSDSQEELFEEELFEDELFEEELCEEEPIIRSAKKKKRDISDQATSQASTSQARTSQVKTGKIESEEKMAIVRLVQGHDLLWNIQNKLHSNSKHYTYSRTIANFIFGGTESKRVFRFALSNGSTNENNT